MTCNYYLFGYKLTKCEGRETSFSKSVSYMNERIECEEDKFWDIVVAIVEKKEGEPIKDDEMLTVKVSDFGYDIRELDLTNLEVQDEYGDDYEVVLSRLDEYTLLPKVPGKPRETPNEKS